MHAASILPNRSIRLLIAVSATAAVMFSVGCQPTRTTVNVQIEHEPDSVTGQLDFWHGIAARPAVNNNEAFHGLILLANNKVDPNENYEQRRKWLIDQGYLDAGFFEEGDRAVNRGTVAQVLCGVLRIKGGLTMHLIGPHPRYATRELVHLEIYDQASPQQGFSGIQFVETVSRAERYREDAL